MKRNRRRYLLISAIAIWFFALGLLWFSLSGLAQETKPGSVSKNSRGGYNFTGSTIGNNKQPGKRKPTATPQPTSSPTKKGCDKEQRDKDKKCGEFERMQKEWHDKCVDHYEAHRSECDGGAAGAGLAELETACEGAKNALDKCQGKKTGSQPGSTPSPPPCDQLQAYADEACEFANEFECACSGSQYSKNYDWCEAASNSGQSVQARVESLRKSCREISTKLQQQCHGRSTYWSNAPCNPVQKPTRHEINCLKLLLQFLDCSTSECDKLRKQYQKDCSSPKPGH